MDPCLGTVFSNLAHIMFIFSKNIRSACTLHPNDRRSQMIVEYLRAKASWSLTQLKSSQGILILQAKPAGLVNLVHPIDFVLL